ncbi:hypothetical protein D0864_05589 [Hortaea werneckii]|uniref:MT-A70-domain-containing protein n=1 Tax=Hortaea werneckii TaxID=91943 RepID=A0A3M7FZW1_HORWE|nr:hypothetical protein D0864_05589 [Hortaea werneckii]RMZ11471.1 hypothetical protein D0862_02927 [Hortaea werneckii]
MASPVLWQNESQTTILIDIPRSIEAAQGTPEAPCHDHLLSVTPLETPFPSNKPKSEAARAKLVGNSTDEQLDREYVELLSKALTETHKAYHGRWCLPRPFVQERPRAAKKRKLEGNESSNSVQSTHTQEGLPEDLLRTLAETDHSSDPSDYKITLHPTQGSPANATTSTPSPYITNRNPRPATLSISPHQTQHPHAFHLPPASSFSLSNCTHSTPFRHSLRSQADTEETPYPFDLILLDPPWPNRSIKRTHLTPHRSRYPVAPNLPTITDLLHSLDLEMLMSPSCVVGVWITNKPSIRETVLDPSEGVFAAWGAELVEEWVWMKTTARGEPVSSLEGVWRRPYEVLLVGRRRKDGMSGTRGGEGFWEEGLGEDGDDGEGERKVKRRVILGVPDLHSRKPCLKGLMEEILLRDHHHHHGHHHHDGRTGYRALEVFARNLVAGWWSWGDECLKFNWEGYWRSGDERETKRQGEDER